MKNAQRTCMEIFPSKVIRLINFSVNYAENHTYLAVDVHMHKAQIPKQTISAD